MIQLYHHKRLHDSFLSPRVLLYREHQCATMCMDARSYALVGGKNQKQSNQSKPKTQIARCGNTYLHIGLVVGRRSQAARQGDSI